MSVKKLAFRYYFLQRNLTNLAKETPALQCNLPGLSTNIEQIYFSSVTHFIFKFHFNNKTACQFNPENPQIRVFADFSIDHFPKSKIDSKSRFKIRIAIFLFKFFLKSFC